MANFTSPVVLQPDVITSGTYTGLSFFFLAEPGYLTVESETERTVIPLQPRVTFELPGALDNAHPFNNDDTLAPEFYYVKRGTGNNVTVAPCLLEPKNYDDATFEPMHVFAYTGAVYKALKGSYPDTPITGADLGWGDGAADINLSYKSAIIIPWKGITVPANAGAVRFECQWDLDGIIEQYPGPDSSPNTADDIFVLAKNFWERFSLVPVIE
jgi:hypothetical protein